METIIRAHAPLKQKLQVTCRKDKEWKTYFVNIYNEESYPGQPERKPSGEELTMCFDNKEDVEKFIALIRKATKKMK